MFVIYVYVIFVCNNYDYNEKNKVIFRREINGYLLVVSEAKIIVYVEDIFYVLYVCFLIK